MENTIMYYETTAGEKIGLTITFALLYKVKGECPEAYKRYNDVMMNGMKDIFDATSILYAAYLCANIENAERLPYTQFLEVLGDDMTGVMRTAAALMGRKKKAASATHS